MSAQAATDRLNAVTAISFFRISLNCGYSFVVIPCDSIINRYQSRLFDGITQRIVVQYERENKNVVFCCIFLKTIVQTRWKRLANTLTKIREIIFELGWMMKDNRDRSIEMSKTLESLQSKWIIGLHFVVVAVVRLSFHFLLVLNGTFEAYQLSCVFKWNTESIFEPRAYRYI